MLKKAVLAIAVLIVAASVMYDTVPYDAKVVAKVPFLSQTASLPLTTVYTRSNYGV
jgi:hypothetical protein